MGFEYFYGFVGGETDQWTPYLFRNTTQVFPWIGKQNYNLITDMADDAINYMNSLNAAAPDKPFFVYYVPGGTHSPHQPKKEWIDKFKGKFDMGWEKLREQIFENQKRHGVIPAHTQLTPWPADLPRLLRYVFTGRGQAGAKGVLYLHDLDRIEIACDRPLPLQADGEDLGDVEEAVFEAERDAVAVLI